MRHLRYFVAVAEELNFTRAAQRLKTAQPSLSQQIKQLEVYVGVPLFERSKRSVALTEAGRVFLAEANEILRRTEQAVHLAMQADYNRGIEISVGVVPAAEVKVLPKLLPLLERRLPRVRLILHNLPSAEQKKAFVNGTLDIGFLRGPLRDPALVVEHLLDERLLVGLPSGHPLARKKTISIADLQPHRFIMVSRSGGPELHDAVKAFCEKASLKARAVQQADNVLGNLNLIRAGVGFALLPDYVSAILPKGVLLRPLEWQPTPTVPLVVARRNDSSATLSAFMKLVRECFPLPSKTPD